LQIKVGADLGALLLDGFGDGVLLTNDGTTISNEAINSIAFGVLQATRRRVSRTEYISCPSCGRTLFDLQSTVAKVKAGTSHLKNLKIAVMGCIVNGPGEMADADYGYVGAGKGRISLYRKNECVERNIPAEEAVEKLLALIESDKINPSS
ncbi:MAG TPA: flavodoxin-dependent (E)-4-hydroxy-3-methylbut-2-enyl-diphosphate synthase, partial [Paludibacteraceae bacterium]|nr:flavodoxin-dependent (E)-4-hydroxy-3-methylbut-2-enyl-diphosphate synthase [Paludibacteraceae bacterium]